MASGFHTYYLKDMAKRSALPFADQNKSVTSYRLTDECRRLLLVLAKDMGITRTTVIEVAVRDLASRRAVMRAGSAGLPAGTPVRVE